MATVFTLPPQNRVHRGCGYCRRRTLRGQRWQIHMQRKPWTNRCHRPPQERHGGSRSSLIPYRSEAAQSRLLADPNARGLIPGTHRPYGRAPGRSERTQTCRQKRKAATAEGHSLSLKTEPNQHNALGGSLGGPPSGLYFVTVSSISRLPMSSVQAAHPPEQPADTSCISLSASRDTSRKARASPSLASRLALATEIISLMRLSWFTSEAPGS